MDRGAVQHMNRISTRFLSRLNFFLKNKRSNDENWFQYIAALGAQVLHILYRKYIWNTICIAYIVPKVHLFNCALPCSPGYLWYTGNCWALVFLYNVFVLCSRKQEVNADLSSASITLRKGMTKGFSGKLVVSWSLAWKSSIVSWLFYNGASYSSEKQPPSDKIPIDSLILI